MKNFESQFIHDKSYARQIAFQALFQLDFNNELVDAEDDPQARAIEMAINESENFNEDFRDYVDRLVRGTVKFRDQIDSQINKFSTGWNIRRMNSVDRNLIRLAIYEMKFAEKTIPHGAAIDSVVELAKIFGSDESPKFVNGLLGAFSRDGQPREKKSKTKSEKQSQT